MKKYILFAIFLLKIQCASPQVPGNPSIYRIGDYGKLWCVLKLFHPAMGYNVVNEDSLFTENIDGLLKDPSAMAFRNAVQGMIDRLHDPYTAIETGSKKTNDTIYIPPRQKLRWLPDSIVLLHFDEGFIAENSDSYNNKSLLQLIDSIKNARGIIIDLRKNNNIDGSGYDESGFMKQLIGYLTDHDLVYPSYRTRIHYGHESETFDMSSFYYQGWFSQKGEIVKKKKQAIQRPVCLVINRFNNTVTDAIAAMQEENIASIIADDSLGNFELTEAYQMKLCDSITVNVRLTETVYPGGNKTFLPDTMLFLKDRGNDDPIIRAATYSLKSKGNIKKMPSGDIQNININSGVNGYDSLAYPGAALRLLGLMRYWSAINYFCPNKDRVSKNWDSVLYEYVPQFMQAKDSLDYALTAARLIKEINDTHGFFSSPVFDKLIEKTPPVQLKYVENKTIVYKIFNDTLKKNLSVGDEIIAIDNIPLKIFRDSIAQYIGASNNASLQRDITIRLLAGRENSAVNIKLLHNGKPAAITLPRTSNLYQVAYRHNDGPICKKITDKIGYFDMGRLEVSQVDSMFNAFMNTDAIIIDDRSYPRGTVWTLVSYLSTKPVISAKGTTIIASSPDPLSLTRQEDLWELPVSLKPQYKGKIIILVNETTLSQAEYSCMVLQAADKKVTIIGSQTSGADGDVTGIKIPGGIQTAFSGHGIHYPDDRPTQGIGIVPDIRITPTLAGIKSGRDEVLERAINFAKTGK